MFRGFKITLGNMVHQLVAPGTEATLQSPEIPCCSMPIQPVVQRPAEKITMARLTGVRCQTSTQYIGVVDVHGLQFFEF